MTASQMIEELRRMIDRHGDLKIGGGNLSDDTPPRRVIAVDAEGCDVEQGYGRPAFEFFVE